LRTYSNYPIKMLSAVRMSLLYLHAENYISLECFSVNQPNETWVWIYNKAVKEKSPQNKFCRYQVNIERVKLNINNNNT